MPVTARSLRRRSNVAAVPVVCGVAAAALGVTTAVFAVAHLSKPIPGNLARSAPRDTVDTVDATTALLTALVPPAPAEAPVELGPVGAVSLADSVTSSITTVDGAVNNISVVDPTQPGPGPSPRGPILNIPGPDLHGGGGDGNLTLPGVNVNPPTVEDPQSPGDSLLCPGMPVVEPGDTVDEVVVDTEALKTTVCPAEAPGTTSTATDAVAASTTTDSTGLVAPAPATATAATPTAG